jgi:N utilization substance protein A
MLNSNKFNEHLELQSRPELIEMVNLVAKEKNISNEDVLHAMEFAIKKIALHKYGLNYDIRADINKNNGAIFIKRIFTVVNEIENPYFELLLADAKKLKPDAVLGDEIEEILPQVDFGRVQAQGFRQNVLLKLREVEKQKEYEAYKDKVGEIVNGTVRRKEFGNLYLELSNKAEAFLSRDNCIPRENLEVGARVRALVLDVKRDLKSPQIILSRSSSDFIVKLFNQEIPEIYEGVIEIKAISRDAGSRCKVALMSNDQSIDPVGTAVGFKGSKIQGILSELKGEKIDLVAWSNNIATFVVNSFRPTEVLKVVIDQDNRNIDVVVRNENLSLAIGRAGQNINLISRLVEWHINLMSEEKEKEERQKSLADKVALFKEALDVDDMISQLLAIEGVNSVNDIAEEKVSLANIPGFNQEIIDELKGRAQDYLSAKEKEAKEEVLSLKVSQDLVDIIQDNQLLLILSKAGIKNKNDLSDLSVYDLLDLLPKDFLEHKKAEELILLARDVNK